LVGAAGRNGNLEHGVQMKKNKPLKFEQIKKKALDHLRSGKWLYGKDGVFASLFKRYPDQH